MTDTIIAPRGALVHLTEAVAEAGLAEARSQIATSPDEFRREQQAWLGSLSGIAEMRLREFYAGVIKEKGPEQTEAAMQGAHLAIFMVREQVDQGHVTREAVGRNLDDYLRNVRIVSREEKTPAQLAAKVGTEVATVLGGIRTPAARDACAFMLAACLVSKNERQHSTTT